MNILAAGLAAALGASAAMGAAVEREVALSVAEGLVAREFAGEDWVAVDSVAVEDGEGATAAWAFVFALAGSPYAEEGAVRAAVAGGEVGDDGESDLYVSTATVVTGANDTDSLFFRHFRGLAGWYGELAADAAAGKAGTAVRLGAGDIRYAPAAVEGARGAGRLGALRKAAAARAAGRAAEREALPEEAKSLQEEADAEAAAAAKARWGAAASAARRAERQAAAKAAVD